MAADYRRTGLSVGIHPLTLLRPHLPEGTLRSDGLHRSAHGSTVAYAGLAIARQRPATANGIVFMLLEDELGQVNLIVPKRVYEQHRAIVRNEPLLLAHGRYERVGENRNILVTSIETLGCARPPGRRARRRCRAPAGTPLRASLTASPTSPALGSRSARLPVRSDRLEAEPRVGGDRRVVVGADVQRDRLDPVPEQQQAERGARTPREALAAQLGQRRDVAERRDAPGRRVDVHAGDAGEAALAPDADVAAGREHPGREPRLRIGVAVERLELGQVALSEELDRERAVGSASARVSASLRCGSAYSTA